MANITEVWCLTEVNWLRKGRTCLLDCRSELVRSTLQGFEREEWNVRCCCQHSLAQSSDRTSTYILPSSNSGIMLITQLIFIVTLLHMCEIYIKKDYYLFRLHINVTGTKWIYLQLTTAIYMQNLKSIINSLYECIYIYMHFYKVFTCLFVLFLLR
jgi:hypothetical protein